MYHIAEFLKEKCKRASDLRNFWPNLAHHNSFFWSDWYKERMHPSWCRISRPIHEFYLASALSQYLRLTLSANVDVSQNFDSSFSPSVCLSFSLSRYNNNANEMEAHLNDETFLSLDQKGAKSHNDLLQITLVIGGISLCTS